MDLSGDPRAYLSDARLVGARAQLGYDLLEVICGPAKESFDPTRAPPDPNFMPGSAMDAALVRVQAKAFQLRISLEDRRGPCRFPVERSSTWLRPR